MDTKGVCTFWACSVALTLFATLETAHGISGVTLTSIQPNKLTVNLTYDIAGQMQTLSPVCTEQAPGSTCLPKPHAVRDSILVKWAVMSNATANTSDTALIKACYSPFSRVNRPWRALNNIIAKSKACPFAIAMGKNPSGGNVTWKIPQNVPTGTYFIRTLIYAKNQSDPTGASNTPVAIGDSKGFFQVIPVSHKTSGLTTAAGICMCVGPVLFALLMLWEFKFAPKKNL